MFEDIERSRKLLHEPIEQARRLGILDPHSDLRTSIDALTKVQRDYEALFRIPEITEISRLAAEATKSVTLYASDLFGAEQGLKEAMASMNRPWLAIEESRVSAKAFAEIIAMGRGLQVTPAFDLDYGSSLRSGLGDWRDRLSLPLDPFKDQFERSDFYVACGFNPELVDFTSVAFEETLEVAGLREQEDRDDGDEQETAFARSAAAFDQLQRLETAVRRFIERVMEDAFGENWTRSQLPNNMRDSWVEKQERALKAGHEHRFLIDYADFTDYCAIIERRDNWRTAFNRAFGRIEDIRESFQRLFPVRIATMHSRPISLDDELLLRVEPRRIMKAISSS